VRLHSAVERLYDRNRQAGFAPWCGRAYDFVCPSVGTYPFQWFWDSAFHAIVLSRFDVARARTELRCLLANQQEDGFVAHVTFWQRERYQQLLANYCILYRTPHLSDCIQPPVLALALEAVHRRTRGTDFLAELLPKVSRYHDWLDRVRDPDRDGLVANLLPDESGLDHAPKFDDYLRVQSPSIPAFDAAWARVAGPYQQVGREPAKMFALDLFVVEEVLTNSLYCEGQRILGDLWLELGDAAAAAEYHRRARRTRDALLEKCFDAPRGLFLDLAGAREEPLRVSTVTSLMPLLIRDLPEPHVAALIRHLETDYAAPWPVPTVSPDEPTFRERPVGDRLLWRGPSWINVNWLLMRGLLAHGRDALARELAEKSAQLVERHGFREYYNPFSGEGYGAQGFSWSALVLDMLEEA
jgi:glycogen debranching enzyme